MAGPHKNGRAPNGNGASGAIEPDADELNARGDRRRGNGGGANGSRTEPAPRLQYNCAKCPGYCCSYPVIDVTKRDLERLAKHFGLSPDEAEKRFTKSAHGHKRIMRRKKDEHFGMTCHFFDTEQRRCTIYAARPAICRSYPGTVRCGYYDFLSFERRAQNDPEFVALTDHR